MARFRCPSSSTVSTRGGSVANINATRHRSKTPGPSTNKMPGIYEASEGSNHPAPVPVPPVRKLDKGKGRARIPKADVRKREEVRMAMKKSEMKGCKREWSFVFVGNLSSSVNEPELETIFKRYGPIRCIKIRASGGVCVPTANLPRPYWGFGQPLESVHYATVEYTSSGAARKALELNGLVIAGRKIVVSFSIVDMPETTDIIKNHLKKKDPSAHKRSIWKERFGQLKRLTIEKTEYVPDPENPNGNAAGNLVAGVAERLTKLLPAAGVSTAAGGHQNRYTHGGMIPYPNTLV